MNKVTLIPAGPTRNGPGRFWAMLAVAGVGLALAVGAGTDALAQKGKKAPGKTEDKADKKDAKKPPKVEGKIVLKDKANHLTLAKTIDQQIQTKLDAKFAKLSKLLEKRGEREAHVVVRQERHLSHAEITIQFYDHQLVGIGSDGDLFTAVSQALERIESQAVKQRDKWREKHRRGVAPDAVQASSDGAGDELTRRVYRVRTHERRKPITLDEAVLMMDKNRDYVVYRDADRDCLSVLVRRRDGHFDLIES